MLNSFKVLKVYKKKFIISYMIVILLVIITSIFILPITNEYNVQHIPLDMVYYQGDKVEQLEAELDNYPVEYETSVPLFVEKTDGEKIELMSKSEPEDVVEYEKLKVRPFTTEKLSKDLVQNVKLGKKSTKIAVLYNFTPDLINDVDLTNDSMSVYRVLNGNYPKQGQVMIPEIYALSLVNEKGYSGYDDIIGETVTISVEGQKEDLIVSGIYIGENNFIINPSEEIKTSIESANPNINNGLFMKFDNYKSKKEFINSNSDYELYTTFDYKVDILVNNLEIIIGTIIFLFFNTLMLRQYKEYLKIRNHYNYSKLNIIDTVLIPNVILGLIIVLLI